MRNKVLPTPISYTFITCFIIVDDDIPINDVGYSRDSNTQSQEYEDPDRTEQVLSGYM